MNDAAAELFKTKGYNYFAMVAEFADQSSVESDLQHAAASGFLFFLGCHFHFLFCEEGGARRHPYIDLLLITRAFDAN